MKLLFQVILLLALSALSSCVEGKKPRQKVDRLSYRELRIEVDSLKYSLDHNKVENQILQERIDSLSEDLKRALVALDESKKIVRQSDQEQFVNLREQVIDSFERQKKMNADIAVLTRTLNDAIKSLQELQRNLQEMQKISEKRDAQVEDKLKQTRQALGSVLDLIESQQKAGFHSYVVQEGDSLEKIARKHQTSVDVLKKINDLDSDLIVIGRELKLP